MANVVTQNPIIIDTAGASAVITQPLRVRKFVWDAVGHATDDHVCSVKDKNGVQKWKRTLTSLGTVGELVSAQSEDFDKGVLNMDGLIVDTLGGGVLYVYVEDNPPFKTT